MSDELNKSVLHDAHVAAGATMVERDGWLIPADYGDVDAEVAALRDGAGVFDASHLGRLRIRGDGALALLETVCSADVARQEDDTAELTDILGPGGQALDSGFILRLEGFWVLTTSVAARETVLARLKELAPDVGAKVDDQTFMTTTLVGAGPKAAELLDEVLPEKVSPLPVGMAKMGTMMVARYIVMRADVGGLWSLEVTVPNLLAPQAWGFIMEEAGDGAFRPVGAEAWDIVRGKPKPA